jgi:hypothetical protein
VFAQKRGGMANDFILAWYAWAPEDIRFLSEEAMRD